MPTIEQKIAPPPMEKLASENEKREASALDAVKGFEERAETLLRALEETKKLAEKDPEKAAVQQKELEANSAGFWLNVRIAQSSRVRLGDTPQEISKNSATLDQLTEKLGRQPPDAFVYFLEKILTSFQEAFGKIEEKWLKRESQSGKSLVDEVTKERTDLSERLNTFIEQKIFLVKEILVSHELKRMPKEEKDALTARAQRVENKARNMCRAADAPLEVPQEKAEQEKAEKK
jgi:hypothetical protein